MQIIATVNTDNVATALDFETVTEVVWTGGSDYNINDGRLSEVVNAVLKHIEFEFDREDVTLVDIRQEA